MIPLLVNQHRIAEIVRPATIASWQSIHPILNTAGWALDENGASVDAEAASGCLITMGGPFRNISIRGEIKFITPTVAGSEDIALILNWNSNFVAGVRSYLMARQVQGVFRITKVVTGSGSTVASVNNVLAQNTWLTVDFERRGTAVRARFDDGAWIEGTVTEADVPLLGNFGFRSGFGVNSTVSLRSFTARAWM